MQVSNQYHNPMQDLINAKQEAQKEINKNGALGPTQSKQKPVEIKESSIENLEKLDASRQTYGLLVLELMSDPEYQAFQRATAGMNEGEKIIAAQSLYSLTSFYGGKLQDQQDVNKSSVVQNALKAYPNARNQDFINRYKNAFVSQNQIDLSS